MEAASTYETSVNFYQTTRRNNPEDSHLHTRWRENLKSYFVCACLSGPRITSRHWQYWGMKRQESGSLTSHIQKSRLWRELLRNCVWAARGYGISTRLASFTIRVAECYYLWSSTEVCVLPAAHCALFSVSVCVWNFQVLVTVYCSVSGGTNLAERARSKNGLDLQKGEWIQIGPHCSIFWWLTRRKTHQMEQNSGS
jgi:hypothetical protein